MSSEFFDYAEKNKFALFPCKQGTKRPILKWKTGSTHDRAHWATWQSDHNNLAVDCAKSGIIVVDVDSSKVTREEAWGAYSMLCNEWGLPSVADPMTQSARGGWHIPFKRPAHLAATDLRGGGTLVKISDIRPLAEGEEDGEVIGFKNRGYCVAPDSILSTSAGNLPYMLMTNPPAPYEAPERLLDLIKLKVIEATNSGQTGTSDKADVAKLVAELDMHGEFSTEPDWFKYMGAIKLALGDTEEGVEVALQMTTDDATAEAFWSRWKRLASVDNGATKCRINSMIHRYKQLTGKHFNVRTSVASMFAGVAAGAPGMPPLPTVDSTDAPTQSEYPPPQAPDSVEMPPARLMQKLGARLKAFVLPEYLWDGILIKRSCYSLTAQTGVGKTAIALLLAMHVALGKALCGRDVEKGSVIYLAGENPTDVDMRWHGLCHELGLDPDALDIHIIAGAMDITKHADQIRAECEADNLKPAAVFVDTAAAYFGGSEENGNTEYGNYARQLRELCKLPGEPCVVILAHPVKNAEAIGEMVPRGGGAFLNEMDGNLGAARIDGLIGVQSVGKFRGPEFAPLHFGVHGVPDVPALFNPKKGKFMPTVVAAPVSEAGAAARAREGETADIQLLRDIDTHPRDAHRDRAPRLGCSHTTVGRRIEKLAKRKLVDDTGLHTKLTPKGQKELNDLDTVHQSAPEGVPFPVPTRP
jgi:AAA domain-containing protein/bifunctional DNA primase/polymerase-like protein